MSVGPDAGSWIIGGRGSAKGTLNGLHLLQKVRLSLELRMRIGEMPRRLGEWKQESTRGMQYGSQAVQRQALGVPDPNLS